MKGYWDRRYLSGASSGGGSVGRTRDWKWGLIDEHVEISGKSVLDVGCGDLSFWENRDCKRYTGLDFSDVVIEKNLLRRPDWSFRCTDASEPADLSTQIVLCLDVLFHVLEDPVYEGILRNLSRWTEEKLFIYTWWRSPFREKDSDGWYQYYRPLMESVSLLKPLALVGEYKYTPVGAMYVFKRETNP